MAKGSPSRTRTGSKRIPCAPSSPRPRACVKTGGDGESSLLDPTPQLSRLKVRKLDIYSYVLEGTQAQFLIDICCVVILSLSLESINVTTLHLANYLMFASNIVCDPCRVLRGILSGRFSLKASQGAHVNNDHVLKFAILNPAV